MIQIIFNKSINNFKLDKKYSFLKVSQNVFCNLIQLDNIQKKSVKNKRNLIFKYHLVVIIQVKWII